MSDTPSQPPPPPKPRPNAELPPSILSVIEERTGEAPRVTLREEDSATVGAPLIDPGSDERRALPQGRSSYQVLGEIARGGMGVILKGHDTDLGRDVAMKVLAKDLAGRPEVVQRFVEEAQIGGQLQHPGIVPVYELGLMADERPYFTMKLVKGRTLATLLAERESVGADRRRLVDVFESVCQTMAYAHSRGVIHRDLKPANIMVGAFGEVQVVDWGLAKVMARGGTADEKRAKVVRTELTVLETVRSEGSGSGSESMVGSVMGTPAYMPPEQASGRVDRLDERSDVFALGAILCEILTGAPPYASEREKTLLQAAQADLDDALGRLDGCEADPELVKLCKQCLMAAPAARPRNAGVVAESVHRHLETVEERARGAQIEAAEARVRATQERKARRLTLALAAAVLAAIVLGGGGWVWAQQERAASARALAEREHQLEAEVNEALGEASLLLGQERWDDAVAAAERARAVTESGSLRSEVSARVAAVLYEVQGAADEARRREERDRDTQRLLARLQEARDPDWGLVDPGGSSARIEAETAEVYAAAFAAHDLDVDGSSPEAIAAALAERGLGADVALFLDAWSDARRAGGDVDGALHLLEIAHLVDPDAVRADLREAVANRDAQMLRSLAEGDLASQPPATLELLAAALLRLGDRESALSVLRESVGIHPQDVSLHVELARRLTPGQDPPGDAVQRAEYLEALTHDWAALGLRPESVAVRYHLGRLYSRLGQYVQAASMLQVAADTSPDNAAVRLALGIALTESRGDPRRASAELQRARELSEVWWIHFWSHFYEALILRSSGDLDAAAEHCLTALELRPANVRAGSLALQLEVERENLDRALQRLEEILPFSGAPDTLRNDLAWFLASSPLESMADPDQVARCRDEAVRLAEMVVRRLPQDGNALNTLSVARLRAGDAEGALAAAQRAMVLAKGGQPHDWLALSLAHSAVGELDQARLWYELADSTFRVAAPTEEDLQFLHAEAARRLGLPSPYGR